MGPHAAPRPGWRCRWEGVTAETRSASRSSWRPTPGIGFRLNLFHFCVVFFFLIFLPSSASIWASLQWLFDTFCLINWKYFLFFLEKKKEKKTCMKLTTRFCSFCSSLMSLGSSTGAVVGRSVDISLQKSAKFPTNWKLDKSHQIPEKNTRKGNVEIRRFRIKRV